MSEKSDYRRAGKPRPTLVVRRSQGSWARAWEYETPPAQHRRLSSASHARRAGIRERSSRYHKTLQISFLYFYFLKLSIKHPAFSRALFLFSLLFFFLLHPCSQDKWQYQNNDFNYCNLKRFCCFLFLLFYLKKDI